jgi:hypothetical protein
MRSSLTPRGRAPRIVAVEVTHEFDGGERYTRRYTGRGVEGHTFEREVLPGGRARSRLVVEADEQSITPRYQGAAPVRRR